MKMIISGERLALRETVVTDLPYVLAAERDPENRPYILPWTEQQHREALDDPDMAHLVINSLEDGQPIGFVILIGLTNPHDHLCLQRIVVTEKGKGYGREALRLCKRYAFEQTTAHRFWLDVKVQNMRAYQLYLSEGFQEEGILREVLKEGNRYTSLRVMAMLRQEYISGTGLPSR